MARSARLDGIAEDLCGMLEASIDGVEQATDLADRAEQADAVCTYYPGVGICELLLDAEDVLGLAAQRAGSTPA